VLVMLVSMNLCWPLKWWENAQTSSILGIFSKTYGPSRWQCYLVSHHRLIYEIQRHAWIREFLFCCRLISHFNLWAIFMSTWNIRSFFSFYSMLPKPCSLNLYGPIRFIALRNLPQLSFLKFIVKKWVASLNQPWSLKG